MEKAAHDDRQLTIGRWDRGSSANPASSGADPTTGVVHEQEALARDYGVAALLSAASRRPIPMRSAVCVVSTATILPALLVLAP